MWRRCFTQPTDKMRTAFILLAVVAVVSAYAVSESDESGSDESRRSNPRIPCPDVCTAEYDPVCAEDKEGNLYKFSNPCMMQACRCRMCCGNWLRQVPLERCPDDAPSCPLNSKRPAQLDSADSSDESQSASSQQQRRHRTNALRHESEEAY